MKPIFYRDYANGGEKPFPYLIIEDFYDEEELGLIWRELDFLTDLDKFLGPEQTGTAHFDDGKAAKQNRGLFLDNLYSERTISNILTINRKLINCGVIQTISKHSLMFKGMPDCNHDDTLISYYEDSEYYKPHKDIFNFTALTWFFREPKKFEGGDLVFTEFGEIVKCENNKCIVFPSALFHEVPAVEMKEQDMGKGLGRYCMSQFFYIHHKD